MNQKFPSKIELEKILNKYQEINLKGVSYPKLFSQIYKDLRFIPFTTSILKKDSVIERARINKNDEIFFSEREISYRTDIEKVTTFGRANSPYKSLFYGSIVSEKIQNPRIVNLIETEETFRVKSNVEIELIYTVGKWRLLDEIEVAEIVFSKKVREQNKKTKEAFEFYVENLKKDYPEDYEYYIRVLDFFSDQFSKKEINCDDDYKFSVIYMDLALEKGLHGIIYPSVRTEYLGNNIALPISVVDEFLCLEIAAMFKVNKNGNITLIDNAKIATDLGPMNSKFVWEDEEELKENQINKILFSNELIN
ncbi:MAG: hypothetical protein K9G36_04055 [Crocinitomicaceae bacterium]|nr:hypothetical protein [Crocinitomicaceae bacterium]MCF8410115.1 hypothetical protein [Crocinitomicaceae bacterium]MCF8443508.1 hypothetical protein [Crocinitomicaceae bacterium]